METRLDESVTDLDAISCWTRFAHHLQDGCYQFLAVTNFYECIVAGFKPGRQYAIDALEIQPTDRVLLVGEGAGADFECLPSGTDFQSLKALDYSPQMVRNAKNRARELGIPEENIFEGDAQSLPFIEEKFDKILFPLSIGSIPNPQKAIKEAERVLAPGGKIAIFEKMVDDQTSPSYGRRCVGFFTKCIFSDINRNLTEMMGGEESPLMITQYDSLAGQMHGCFAGNVDDHYPE